MGDDTPEQVYHYIHYMNVRWEERARMNSRYFTDTLHFDNERTWEARAAEDVEMILSGVEREDFSGRRLLEIGCGPGRLLSRLKERFGLVVGLDLAPTMLRDAREVCGGAENVGLVNGKGHDLAFFRDDSFDFVIMIAVAIHVPREICSSYLSEGRRVLRPGGRMRFTLRREPDDEETALLQPIVEREAKRIPPEGQHLVTGPDWNGYAFNDDEVEPFLAGFGFAGVTVRAVNPVTFWVEAWL